MKKIISILKNPSIIWNILGVTINSLYSLIIMIFISRIGFNNLELVGQFSYAFYIVALFSIIGSYGGRIYQVSDITGKNNSKYVSLKYVSTTIMFIVTLLFCLINSYDITKVLMIMSLVIYRIFESISDSYYGIMQKHNDLESIGKSMTFKALISTFLFIIVFVFTKNFFLSNLCFILVFAYFTYLYDHKIASKYEKIKIKINKEVFKLLKDSFLVFLFAFLLILIMNVTRYVVDLKLDDVNQGYYGIVIMPAAIIALFAQFIIQPLLNKLVEIYNNKMFEQFKSIVNKVIGAMLLIGIFIFAITYLIGPEILGFVYNTNLLDFRLLLAITIISGILSGCSSILSNMLTVMRKLNIQIVIYTITIVLAALLSVLFINVSVKEAIIVYFVIMFVQFVMFYIVYYIKIKKVGVL